MTSPISAIPYALDGTIDSAIMDALNSIFTSELQVNVQAGDLLKLRKLTEFPLQDDPTKSAPYVVYAPVPDIGRQPVPSVEAEIGAGPLWVTYYKAVAGTPQRSTKATAYQAIDELSRRVERTIMRHYDLSNVLAPGTLYSADKSEFIDAQNPLYFYKGTYRRTFGGGNTFFGEALFIWTYRFRRPPDWIV
jgi:hypothetical protein